ncbi:hypothetical protein NC651_019220 [Populus alba x Populus x berolinensis]|nr:hypothetical protein NC651_019220 [Populus alba x Populus x berolinensis]
MGRTGQIASSIIRERRDKVETRIRAKIDISLRRNNLIKQTYEVIVLQESLQILELREAVSPGVRFQSFVGNSGPRIRAARALVELMPATRTTQKTSPLTLNTSQKGFRCMINDTLLNISVKTFCLSPPHMATSREPDHRR